MTPLDLRIDAARLMARLDTLAAIGMTAEGAWCRLALPDEDRAGRDQVVQWMRELGLAVQVDGIGNIFGRRAGTEEVSRSRRARCRSTFAGGSGSSIPRSA